MEFAANGVVELPELANPGRQLIQAKRGVPPLLGVPVDRRDWVLGGQRTRCLARMIIDRPQAAHTAVRNVGTVFLRDLLVARHYKAWIIAQHPERLVEPVRHQALNVIAAILDRSLASTFSLEMSITIPRPGSPQREINIRGPFRPAGFQIGSLPLSNLLWSRVDSFSDQSQQRLGLGARFARSDFTHFTDLEPQRLSLAVLAQVGLHHEGFGSSADHHEEAGEFGVPDDLLPRGSELEGQNCLVGQS